MLSGLRLRVVNFLFNRATACAYCRQAGRSVDGRYCSESCATEAWEMSNS